MPKGRKRTQADYDKEIIDAARRMRKRPEHLRAARNNQSWFEFLENIDIGIDTPQRVNFWREVRNEVNNQIISEAKQRATEREKKITRSRASGQLIHSKRTIELYNAEVITAYRDAKGRFTSKKTDKPAYSYRNTITGKFMSPKYMREY